MVGQYKSSWNLKLFSTLWNYKTNAKTSTRFTPFKMVDGMEDTLPIECEISSLKLVVELLPNTTLEEERLLYLNKLNETH